MPTKKSRSFRFIEDHNELPPSRLKQLLSTPVGDIMAPAPLAGLPRRPSVAQLARLLRDADHNTFPVICDGGLGPGGSPGGAAGGGPAAGKHGAAAEAAEVRRGWPLAGVVYRWQLVSLLRHPALLQQLVALQQGEQPAGGGAAGGEAADVAVRLPAQTTDLPADLRMLLLSLLAQGPGEVTPAEEQRLLQQYLEEPAADGDAAVQAPAEAEAPTEADAPAAAPPTRRRLAGCGLARVRRGGAASQEPLPPGLPSARLDLGPLLLRHPLGVTPGAPTEQVRVALRHMGVHDALVHPEPSLLVGLVTRHDLPFQD